MITIPRRRHIIDRKSLAGRLDERVGGSGYSVAVRADVLNMVKAALANGRAEIRRRFEDDDADGAEVVASGAFLIDQVIRTIHDFAVGHVYPAANPTTAEQISIIATGGYGRAELAPHSDIDLMFLLPYRQTPHTEQVIEFMLYMLWDLGLKVGHATRSVEECLRLAVQDMTIRTSLLEARWLWGDQEVYRRFQGRFQSAVVANTGAAFVEAKLAERDVRHERMGDSRYVLEPNIKEGKGGLRDLQTLMWIGKYLYQVQDLDGLVDQGVLTRSDARRFAKAQNFLWKVRCHLHHLADRPEERLTFNVQDDIGRRMGYTDRPGARGVERFMKHYFLIAKDVGDLTRVLCSVLEEQHKKRRFRFPSFPLRRQTVDGFRVDGDRLTVEHHDDFTGDPVKMIRLFREAQRHRLDIHPTALRLVTQKLHLIDGRMRDDADANRLFMEILTSRKDPETALRRLNEAGVFGRFVPDFGRVVAQMQYDMYHVYTVDEHTIRAIGILHRIEEGGLAGELPVAAAAIGEVESRRALYVALLLHDIAKGRGGDHSEIGADIAAKLGPRFGLSEWETETASWLVRHHLLMSRTAFKRDAEDPKTVTDLVAVVQSPERLRLLFILTVADIRAVGPAVWTGWKATLLRELYYRALETMTGGLPAERRDARVERAQAALGEKLADWPKAEIDQHLARGYADYWLTFDTETHLHHALMIRDAHRRELRIHIETRLVADRDVTEITIYTDDHPGLFAAIAGAVALGGASIVDAKITTLADGMALDTLSIQDPGGGPFKGKPRLKKLWAHIEDAVSGALDPARELEAVLGRTLPSRTRVFTLPPRVLLDNKASASHTVIEVNGRDRPGFLHDVTRALTELGLQISSARITTYGERVVDVFYIKDVFGLKAENEEKCKAIRQRLLAAVAPDANKDAGQDGGRDGDKVAAADGAAAAE